MTQQCEADTYTAYVVAEGTLLYLGLIYIAVARKPAANAIEEVGQEMQISDLAYSPFFGQLIWVRDSDQTKKGEIAGGLNAIGYRQIMLNQENRLAHRLIWEMFNGPLKFDQLVDHINRDTDCNYIWNLRLATKSQNAWNSAKPITNTSGVKGVCWNKGKNMWEAGVKHNGDRHREYFVDFEKAVIWVRAKREELHGEFANHG